MKKKLLFVAKTLAVCAMMTLCSACGGNESDDVYNGGSGNGISSGWYIPESFIQSKVNDLSTMANEWISDGITNLFDSDGQLHFYSHSVGWSEWESGTDQLVAIHIINNSTLEAFFGGTTYRLGASVASGKQLLLTVNLGSVIGTVGFYADYKRIYSYDYIDTNRFFFGLGSDGVYEEFSTVNGQLYRNGGGIWEKYEPTTVYQGNVTASYSAPTTEMSLYGMFARVMGTLGVDPQTASINSVVSALQNENYIIMTDLDKTAYKVVSMRGDENPSTKGLVYKGMPFFSFIFSDSQLSYDNTRFEYIFIAPTGSSKNNIDNIARKIESDFLDMGVTLSNDVDDTYYNEKYLCKHYISGKKEYFFWVISNPDGSYTFRVGMEIKK